MVYEADGIDIRNPIGGPLLESIVKNLNVDSNQGSFCTSMTTPTHDLQIRIKNLSELKFPLKAKMVQSLIRYAKPAKFGWKDQTVYDSSVRHVWEISKNQIQISNFQWEQTLNPSIDEIRKKLGLPKEAKLSAHLHNLLIYEPGQFFSAHQDSEKRDGMIATLVVLLPSKFSGGALHVDQQGDIKTFSAPHQRNKLTFIAFYSDCHHEVKKVTSGYRVALTYNLVLEKVTPVANIGSHQNLTKDLEDYFKLPKGEGLPSYRQDDPRWFVYLLDHQYSQRGLKWQQLKGADRKRANLLLSAATELNLEPHLALAEIHETWEAQSAGDDDYGYRNDRYDDDEDFEPQGPEPVDLGEMLENECTLNHWVDSRDKTIGLGSCCVHDSQVCWTKATDEFHPLKSEYEGYMGNYGNTADRWYHRAAIVLWPKQTRYDSLFLINSSFTLGKIQALIEKDKVAGVAALKQVLPKWLKTEIRDPILGLKAFHLAALIQDGDLGQKLVQNIGLDALSAKSVAGFQKLLESYGELWCLRLWNRWVRNTQKVRFSRSEALEDIDLIVKYLEPTYPKLTEKILEYQLAAIIRLDQSRKKESYREISEDMKKHLSLVQKLLFSSANFSEIYASLVSHILANPSLYPVEELAKPLHTLHKAFKSNTLDSKSDRLVLETKNRLKNMISHSRKSGDWSIKTNLNCKCSLCRQLNAFLLKSNELKLVWPLAKDGRQHIHHMIEDMMLPVTHITERKGSPHKLVLTKTKALHMQEAQRRQKAVTGLQKLEALI